MLTLLDLPCSHLNYQTVDCQDMHVLQPLWQPMACQMYSSQPQGEVGGRDAQLLKHVVEWSDAKGTICCLAIKRHPHKDWAVANVKEIKATVNHQQKWWSTLRDPHSTSNQPTQTGFILLTGHCISAESMACTGASSHQHKLNLSVSSINTPICMEIYVNSEKKSL